MAFRRTCIVAILAAIIAVPTVRQTHPAAYAAIEDSLAEFLSHPKVQALKVEALKQFAGVKDHLKTQSAEALLKMQALRTSLGEAYQNSSVREKYQEYSANIQETIVQQVQMLRDHDFSQYREAFLKRSAELYNLSLERATELYNLIKERTPELYNLSLERATELYKLSLDRASELKVYLQSDKPAATLANMLEWLQKDQPASAIAALRALHPTSIFALLAATTVLFVFYKIAKCVCCRRRRFSATPNSSSLREEGAAAAIMKAPTPINAGLRERIETSRIAYNMERRRRSESPAPIATAADDDENMAPAAEHLLSKLNYDSIDDLVAMNGLGDKSAAKIVNWRNKNGPLKNMNDLTKVGLSNIVISNLRKTQLNN